MTIKTEHNGHEITYSENEDVWRCWKMELEAKTLSALKTKLNQAETQARRLANIRVLGGMDSWNAHNPATGVVTLLDGAEHVWFVPDDPAKKNNFNRSRVKVKIDTLILDTDENRKLIEEWQALVKISEVAARKASDCKAAIPRISPADLTGTPPKEKGQ